MKKIIILCLASAIVGAMTGWYTCQKVNNMEQIIDAQDALLERVYTDNPDYWYDVLMETEEYAMYDEIMN